MFRVFIMIIKWKIVYVQLLWSTKEVIMLIQSKTNVRTISVQALCDAFTNKIYMYLLAYEQLVWSTKLCSSTYILS